MTTTQVSKDERSIGELLGDLSQETITLVRQELNLAKTEMSAKAANVGKNAVSIAIGGSLALTGLLAILAGIIVWLGAVLVNYWLAAFIVGGIMLIIGGILAMNGINALKSQDLTPHKTLETLKS